MTTSYKVTTGPSVEPVTLTEAKAALRVDDTASDTLITSLITAARIAAERETRRAFITQTVTLKLDEWPRGGVILLPKPPLVSVTSIAYVDPNGDAQTWGGSNYQVDASAVPARIVPAYGVAWPDLRQQLAPVTIVFQCGYGNAGSDVDEPIKLAIKHMVAHWFEHRGEDVVGTIVTPVTRVASALLADYVVPSVL